MCSSGRAILDNPPHSITARTLRAWARTVLDRSQVKYALKEIDWMFMQASDCSSLSLITESEKEISEEAARTFRGFVDRRSTGEPVQYILGNTEFYGLSIGINSSVLIPRPETEGLVDRALEYIGQNGRPRVLDIGTGSGCIAIALAVKEPGLPVTGVDVSPEALQVATQNSLAHGVHITWRTADYNEPESFEDLGGPFGLIVSNPPYVTAEEYEGLEPEIRLHEPRLALTPGEDQTGPYRQIAILARQLLEPGGLLLAEINEKLGSEIVRILKDYDFDPVEIESDMAGRDRYVLARKS